MICLCLSVPGKQLSTWNPMTSTCIFVLSLSVALRRETCLAVVPPLRRAAQGGNVTTTVAMASEYQWRLSAFACRKRSTECRINPSPRRVLLLSYLPTYTAVLLDANQGRHDYFADRSVILIHWNFPVHLVKEHEALLNTTGAGRVSKHSLKSTRASATRTWDVYRLTG